MDLSKLSDDELQQLYAGATQSAPAAPDLSKLSDAELARMYAESGGQAQPAAEPERAHGAMNAAARGLVDGIPVAGPMLLGGIDRADALVRSVANDTRYSDEMAKAKKFDTDVAAEHPIAHGVGEIAGGVAGTVPLVMAAPAAFGAGAGGLLGRSALSAASGLALGGTDAAVRSGGDLHETAKGAALGAVLGGVAPAAGQIVGAGARKVAEMVGARTASAPGIGASAVGKLAQDAENAGGVDAVRTRMGELGPEAMLLDASPSFEGRAQGLSVLPDTRETIVRPLQQRARGANDRLSADVDQHLGPNMDPATFHAALDAHYAQTVPPLYQQALGQQITVDTAPVLDTIGRLSETEKGGAAQALGRAWGLLHTEHDVPGVGRAFIPDRRPEALHNAKESLDAMIAQAQNQQGSAAASEVRALTIARRGVNNALEAQVPGYAEANRTAQHLFQQRDAFDAGQRLLNAGREAARPAQVAADTAAMTPEVQQAQRLGLRAEVDRAVGTQLNDRVALRRTLMGEGDYNRARMGAVFGDEPTAGLAGAVDREAAFDASHRRIVENSQTEMRKRAADDVAPREVRPGSGDVGTVVAGAAGGPKGVAAAYAVKGAKAAANAVGREKDLARNREMADALVQRQGDQLDRLLAAIIARQEAERGAVGVGRAAQLGTQAATLSQADHLRGYVPFGFVPALR